MNAEQEMLSAELKEEVLERMDLSCEIEDENVLEIIDQVLKEASVKCPMTLETRCDLRRKLFYSIRKLDILQTFLEDPDVTEIMINGSENGVFVERKGKLEAVPDCRISQEKLEELVVKITGQSNRIINEASPLTDARLEDGSRVHIAIPPVALNGPVITIRRFPREPLGLSDLLKAGSLNEDIALFLKRAVIAGYNIFVSGSTGSGKTTLLNILSDFIPPKERIVTIEDTAELQIRKLPNLVRLEARSSVVEGCTAITIRDLLRASLRMRPNRIIVGEVRGAEAVDMLQAFNTGHPGSLSTGHGNSPEDMLSRLETMVLMGMEIPLTAVRRQIASAIELMIHTERMADGRRIIREIAEIDGMDNQEICLHRLYQYRETDMEGTSRIWEKVGELHHMEKMLRAGFRDE